MGRFGGRFESAKQEWETPLSLFAPLDAEFHFTCDVAANKENAKCGTFITANGLEIPWSGVCWMNPPYKETSAWVRKAHQEARSGRATVVCLLPARTNTNWWHDYCMDGEIRFIRGRPKFGGATHGLPQPLAIVIFRPNDLHPSRTGETTNAPRKENPSVLV